MTKSNLSAWCRIFLMVTLTVGLRAATIDEIIATPASWPPEVMVVAAAKATVLKQDQPAGLMLLGAGKKLVVAGLVPDGVVGRIGGVTVKVPLDKTDFLQRVASPGGAVAELVAAAETAPAPAATVRPAQKSAGTPLMQRRLGGQVVRLAGGTLQPADDTALAGVKYFGLYYSASWCGPCRQFTPSLVAAYRKLKAAHPEFEIVFISADRSAGAMRDYMRADNMPWLALKYELRESNAELMRYSGPGIPCLVLVDASGRVISDSYEGDDYVGPQKVLQDTERLLQRAR